MESGAFKVPCGECRFVSELLFAERNHKPSPELSHWCIQADYEASDKFILTRSNVVAHLPPIYPFVLAWIAEFYSISNLPNNLNEQIDGLFLFNPTFTTLGRNIVCAAGECRGYDMEETTHV